MTDTTQFDPIHFAAIYRIMAVNFWESAKILSTSPEINSNGTPANIMGIPLYFLASHAAELLLKSALLKRGFQIADMKKFDYRHNLTKLLEELQKLGVSVTDNTVNLVHGLHSQHLDHALRYTALIDDGKTTYMPPPHLLFEMLEELLRLTRISTQGI